MATITLTRAKLHLLPLLVAVSVAGTGCGSIQKLVGGKKGRAASQQPLARAAQLVTSFTVTADPQTGELKFASSGSEARPGVRQQATPFTRAWDLNLAGRATYNNTTHVLNGDVTLSSTSTTTFHNVKVIVTSISASDVSVKNATGVTNLTGANKPYWSYGDLPGGGSTARNWQFSVPAGVSFSFALSLYADVWSTPPGDGGTTLGLSFLPGNPAKGWAVGQGGKILYTADGGMNWTAQASNVSVDLRDVCFINSEQGWVVGQAGTILVTSNGGKTWRRQESGVSDFQLNAVAFVDANVGYAVGVNGVVLNTTDGGNSWGLKFEAAGDELYDVEAVGNHAWAVGNAAWVLHSDNYGQSWDQQVLPMNELPFPQVGMNAVFCVDFVDANRGWIGGISGLLFRTTNGGASWQRLRLKPDTGYRPNITDIKFVSNTVGWASVFDAGAGTVFRSTDGGSSWGEAILPTWAGLQVITATDTKKVWVGGDGGVIVLTQNGDAAGLGNWFSFLNGSKAQMNDVCFASATRGFAVGNNGTLMRTTDGGKTWQPVPDAPFVNLNGVHFINDTTGWIVGSLGAVFKTTDGGDSWEQQFPPTGRTLTSVYMADANRGWIVGQSGSFFITNDGGMNWDPVPVSFGAVAPSFTRIKFLPDGVTGFAIGQRGALMMTTDGVTWDFGFSGSPEDLNGIGVSPGGHVWIVGQGNVIKKLADDGISWIDQYSGLPGRPVMRGVDFIDENRGFVVGSEGYLLKTVDGGDTWTQIESGSQRDLRAIDFFNEDLGAFVGQNGIIRTYR